jgi:hypothetical protein
MNLQQLQQLPELIKVVITRSPAELKVQPRFGKGFGLNWGL